jgi:hypothetical protein
MREEQEATYGCEEESEKRGVVPAADTVVHPLAVVIAAVYAIIALQKSNQRCFKRLDDQARLTILQ